MNAFIEQAAKKIWLLKVLCVRHGEATLHGNDPKYYLSIATPNYGVHRRPEPTRHFADVDVSSPKMECGLLQLKLRRRRAISRKGNLDALSISSFFSQDRCRLSLLGRTETSFAEIHKPTSGRLMPFPLSSGRY